MNNLLKKKMVSYIFFVHIQQLMEKLTLLAEESQGNQMKKLKDLCEK